jgi:hypothetical protein
VQSASTSGDSILDKILYMAKLRQQVVDKSNGKNEKKEKNHKRILLIKNSRSSSLGGTHSTLGDDFQSI